MASSSRIDDIEILRGFAVLFVILHHLNGSLYRFAPDSLIGTLYSGFMGGVGVDLFFAISGFVIARSLLPTFSQGLSEGQFKRVAFRFWMRRIFRLLPSAWLWLFIILFLQVFFNDSGAFGTFRANLEATIVGILQIANIRFADGFMQYPLGVSFYYWSLSLEEQFYLLFPFLALLGRRSLLAVLITAILFQFMQPRGLNVWYQMFRTDAICFGLLIALMHGTPWFSRFKSICSRSAFPISLSIPALLFLLCFAGSKAAGPSAYHINYEAILSFLVVLFGSLNLGIIQRITPFSRVMLWIGTHSYALYLIHVPAFRFVREGYYRFGAEVGSSLIAAIVLSGLLMALAAHLNYKFVETPLRKWGAAYADRKFGKT